MLAPPTGNLVDVYRRTEQLRRMRKIRREASRSINTVVNAAKSVEAEIADEPTDESQVRAEWFLVHAFPGDDGRALRWLARRRFGAVRFMQQRTDKRNDTKLQGFEPAFPGWLFVFVWDIRKMKDRLRACPGVMGMLCDPVTQEPVPINQPDEDGVFFIDKLRALSWVYEENAPRARRHSAPVSAPTKRMSHRLGPRRPSKQERKHLDRLKKDFKARGLEWDQTTWNSANSLEPHRRIALLTHTLMNAPPL